MTSMSFVLLFFLAAPQPSDPNEAEARVIENMLIANCCWRSPVSEHYSGAADQIRTEVREMLGKGMKRQEILDYYVAQHGDRILSAPPKKGIHLMSYLLPIAALIIGGIGVTAFFRKHRKPEIKTPASDSGPLDETYARRLAEELREH